MDSHDSTKHYVNGPEAFLHTLLAELKDAEKRFKDINIRITKLVTPEVSFGSNPAILHDPILPDSSCYNTACLCHLNANISPSPISCSPATCVTSSSSKTTISLTHGATSGRTKPSA